MDHARRPCPWPAPPAWPRSEPVPFHPKHKPRLSNGQPGHVFAGNLRFHGLPPAHDIPSLGAVPRSRCAVGAAPGGLFFRIRRVGLRSLLQARFDLLPNVSAKAFSTFWQALITFSPSLPGRIDIHAYGASPFHRQDNVLDSDRISGRPWSAGSASAGPRSPPSRSQSPEASCRTPCSGTSRRPAAALPARPPPRHRRFSR